MRRLVVILTTALLALGVLAPVSPVLAQPFRDAYTFTSLWCETVTGGRVNLEFYGAGVSSSGDAWADVYVSTRRTFAFPSAPATGAAVENGDGSVTLTVSQPMSMDSGEPAGTAEIVATLTPLGDYYPVDDRFHEPGYGYRATGSVQDLALVEGSVSALDTTTDLDATECGGQRGEIEYWENFSSRSFVDRGEALNLWCALESDRLGFVYISATADGAGSFADVFVEPRRGFASGYTESFVFTPTSLTADIPLEDEDGPAGAASLSATFTTGDSEVFEGSPSQGSTSLYEVTHLLVAGTATVTVNGRSESLDMSSCEAEDVTYYVKSTSGKQGKGKRPANDAPSGAVALASGASVALKTGGTTEAPEAPCGGSTAWFGHTVWYTVAGTGAPVTVDTAGSDYDTTLGVYTSSGGSFTEVACVDDVEAERFSLQSAVTFDTAAGTTYWVQAGGYGGQFGNLQIAVD